MGWFDCTLIILREGQARQPFLTDFHEKLASININLDISADEFIVFSDSRTAEEKEEKEVAYLTENMSVQDALATLAAWPALGLLSYRHPNFSHYISISYISWDDVLIRSLSIAFNGKEVGFGKGLENSKLLIQEISQLLDYMYIVGDVEDVQEVDSANKLSDILHYIEQSKFSNIDMRRN
jgi:hypothetical protein